MHQVTANEAKSRFGELLDTAIREPVMIQRHGRDVAVVMSAEDYAYLEQIKIDNLRRALEEGEADIAAGRYTRLRNREELHAFFDQLMTSSE